MQEPTLPKKNAFNFLRLVCCLIVIYEHAVVLSEARFPALLRGVAVNVFFTLSGFWVSQSYLRSTSVKEYFLKRCKKILPQYLLVVFASALLLSFFSVYSASQYFSDKGFVKYLVANITTLNFVHPSLPGVFAGIGDGAVNGSLWTIKVEIGFYIILPLIILLSKKKNCENMSGGGGYSCIAIIILYILSALYGVLMPILTERTALPSSLCNQLPAFISYFVSGMFFAFYKDIISKKLNYLVIPCGIIFIESFVFKISAISAIVQPFCLAVITIWLGYHLPITEIGRKVDYSYSMYLVHYPLILCCLACGLFSEHWFFSLICVFGMSFLLGYILETLQRKIFDKPKTVIQGEPSKC